MATSDDIIKAISALGIGTSVGAAITAAINSRASKGKSRAEAADLLIGAAERVGRLNADQDVEIRHLKKTWDDLYMAVLDHIEGRTTDKEFLAILKALRDSR